MTSARPEGPTPDRSGKASAEDAYVLEPAIVAGSRAIGARWKDRLAYVRNLLACCDQAFRGPSVFLIR
jgi:hypothetical protein